MTKQRSPSTGTMPAKHLFFPTAALFAVIAPWLLILSLSTEHRQIIDISIHAKSMLFGFIGALIAGYLLGNYQKSKLLALFLLWIVSRLIEVFSSNSILINLSYSTFGVFLAILIAPKFLVAKKWRNLAMAPLLCTIGLFPLISWILENQTFSATNYLHSFILLISLLMYFMGGRFITPAATRAFADSGIKIPHRVQPTLEAMTMILILLAFISSFSTHLHYFAGVFSGLAAILIAVRLYRWKLHSLNWKFINIWALGTGYTWLGLGLLAFSISLLANHSITSSLHVITIGAVGLLSTSVIVTTMDKHKHSGRLIYIIAIALISIAVISRFLMPFVPSYWQQLLTITAVCWSINFAVVFIYCIRCLNDHYQNKVFSHQS